MSDDQHYLWTENPAFYDIYGIIDDLPADFQTYVQQRELLYCGPKYDFCVYDDNYVRRVFWSRERPPDRCSQRNYAIANREITEKIKSLLGKLELRGHFLIQYWKAIEEIGGARRRRLLTTQDQPFCLITTTDLLLFDPNTSEEQLCSHRLMSLGHKLYVDDDEEESGEEGLGLLSRVFRHQQPEATPDVRCYSSKEYPHCDRTVDKLGSLALPVFEPSPSGGCCSCVGVLQVVQRDGCFNPSLYKKEICRALEDVGLKCSQCNHLYGQNNDKDEALERTLLEIKELLEVVCTTHCLPLAQTWVLCRLCNAVFTSRSFNSKNTAEYYSKAGASSFLDACAMRQLRKGQGVVGKALSSHNLVFCKDTTQFSITEYPFLHYARYWGLTSCFAICLGSITGDDVYVIELFLPLSYIEGKDPQNILVPILATLRQHFHSFKLASGGEVGDLPIEVIDFSKKDKLDPFMIPQIARSPEPKTLENNEGEVVLLESSDEQLMEVDAIHSGNEAVSIAEKSNIAVTSSQQKSVFNSSRKKHRNAGIQISLEDVQKQFGKKLDDAAESLGVSRSTLKRVCREYGIYWWQSQKRNKDKHSLPNENEPVQVVTQQQIQDSSRPPISDPPRKKSRAAAASTKLHLEAVQDTSSVTIKAKYGGYFIRFELPMSSGIEEFQQQVAMRLPKLQSGTYSVTYQDDENDETLIACDKDLRDYISYSRSLGSTTLKMALQPVTN